MAEESQPVDELDNDLKHWFSICLKGGKWIKEIKTTISKNIGNVNKK